MQLLFAIAVCTYVFASGSHLRRRLFGGGNDIILSKAYTYRHYRKFTMDNGYLGFIGYDQYWSLLDANGHVLVENKRLSMPSYVTVECALQWNITTMMVFYTKNHYVSDKGLYYVFYDIAGDLLTNEELVPSMTFTNHLAWDCKDHVVLPNGNMAILFDSPNYGLTFNKHGDFVGGGSVSTLYTNFQIVGLSNNGIAVLSTDRYGYTQKYVIYNAQYQVVKEISEEVKYRYVTWIQSISNGFMIVSEFCSTRCYYSSAKYSQKVSFYSNDGILLKQSYLMSGRQGYITGTLYKLSNTNYVFSTQENRVTTLTFNGTNYRFEYNTSNYYKNYYRLYGNVYYDVWYDSEFRKIMAARWDITQDDQPVKLTSPTPNTDPDYTLLASVNSKYLPSQSPVPTPTRYPTIVPSPIPTMSPTAIPTPIPGEPTFAPTINPSGDPSPSPSSRPTVKPPSSKIQQTNFVGNTSSSAENTTLMVIYIMAGVIIAMTTVITLIWYKKKMHKEYVEHIPEDDMQNTRSEISILQEESRI